MRTGGPWSTCRRRRGRTRRARPAPPPRPVGQPAARLRDQGTARGSCPLPTRPRSSPRTPTCCPPSWSTGWWPGRGCRGRRPTASRGSTSALRPPEGRGPRRARSGGRPPAAAPRTERLRSVSRDRLTDSTRCARSSTPTWTRSTRRSRSSTIRRSSAAGDRRRAAETTGAWSAPRRTRPRVRSPLRHAAADRGPAVPAGRVPAGPVRALRRGQPPGDGHLRRLHPAGGADQHGRGVPRRHRRTGRGWADHRPGAQGSGPRRGRAGRQRRGGDQQAGGQGRLRPAQAGRAGHRPARGGGRSSSHRCR